MTSPPTAMEAEVKSGTAARAKQDAGFTLLELLVSLALTALLVTAMPAALQFARRSQSAAVALDRQFTLDAATRFVEQRLAEATAIYDRGDDGRLRVIFKGDAQSLNFVAPVSFEPATAGLARVELTVGSDNTGTSGLLMTWQPWRPPAPGDQVSDPIPSRSRVIAQGITNLRLRYFGAPSATEEPDWTENWTRGDTIPDLVEFEISKPGNRVNDIRRRTVSLRLRLPD